LAGGAPRGSQADGRTTLTLTGSHTAFIAQPITVARFIAQPVTVARFIAQALTA